MDSVIQFEGTIYEDGYGLLAQKVMRDRELPKQSKLIYAYMCSFAGVSKNGERTAFPSVSLQCAELGMSEDTYYKWRKPLVEEGYIKITKQRGDRAKFDNNIYSIVAVPTETPKEEKKQPYPKNKGAVNSPYPKKPSTDKPSTEEPSTDNSGTNSNSINSNSININNLNNQDQYQENIIDYINSMKIPLQLKKFFYEKVKVLVNDQSFDITEIEYFYNSNPDFIQPDCSYHDIFALNDMEFTNTIKKMYQEVDRPIVNMRGLIKTWVLSKLHYKMENFNEMDFSEEQEILRG